MYLSYGWYDLVIVTRQSQRLATSATTKRYWNTMYAYVRRNYAKLNNRLMTKRHIVLKQCGENSHPLILVLKRLTGIYSKMYHSPRVINSVRNREVGYFCCQSSSYQIAYAVNNEGVSTYGTHPGSLHITTLHRSLILLMGLIHPDPPLISHTGNKLYTGTFSD